MYMNLKPNHHKRISFNTTHNNHGIIGVHRDPRKMLGPPLSLAPPQNLIFYSGPSQLFWSEIFRPPPPKIWGGEGAATMFVTYFARKFHNHILCFSKINFLKIDVLSRNETKER